MRRLACLLLAILPACDSAGSEAGKAADGEAKAASEVAADAPAAAAKAAEDAVRPLFDDALGKAPCQLLSAAAVAKVAGVAEDALKSREMMGMCRFEWEGGNASLGFIRAGKTLEQAIERWDNAHKDMSGAEVAAALDKIGEGAEKKLEEDAKAGKAAADPRHVKPVVGAMAGSMGGGITFEAVDGVGDAAFFETTRHEAAIGGTTIVSYANKLDVRVGNLSFGVTFSRDGEPAMYRDENVALAKAVVAALP